MRRAAILIALILVQGYHLHAQNAVTLEHTTGDNAFTALDKSFITTGILHDKVINFSNIEKYDGVFDTVCDFSNWKQIYYELYRASVRTPAIPSLEQLEGMTENIRTSAAIPVLFLNVKYNTIKSYALDSSLLELRSGKLYDVSGRSQSPYEEKRAFAAAMPAYRIDDDTKTFYISSDFYISNDPATVASVEIDFGDGLGYRNVGFGQTVTVNFSNVAGKTANNFMTRLTDGEGSIFEAKIVTVSSSCPGSPDSPPPQWPTGSPHVYDFTASIPYLDKAASGHAYFKYGGTPGVLDKPFILVEGIDFGNDHDELRNGELGYCGLFEFAGDDIDKYFFLRHYKDMINDLRSNGYDLILLDFRDGADYVQRNAMLLVELINRLNQYQINCEPMIVAGASMGGQIARYALAYMEQRGIKHNARMYVSMDSPHKGASIPFGLQRMFRWFAEDIGDASARDQLEATLRRPASKQLLVYQGAAPGGVNDFRIPYALELSALGYPQKVRRIGIANGTRNAVGLGFNVGDKLIDYTCRRSPFGVVVRYDVYAVPGAARFQFGNIIFDGEMTKIEKGFLSAAIITWKKLEGFSGPPDPYDNSPGGMRNTVEDAVKEINKKLEKAGCSEITTYHPKHSFIPTISALDINTDDLFYQISDIDIKNPNPSWTSFHATYAPKNVNEQHSEASIGVGSNIEFVLNEVYAGENKLQTPLTITSPNTGIFNFGDPRRWHLPSVVVKDGGRLHVNANIPTDYGTGNIPFPGSIFKVETYDCGSIVEIQNNGQFILGETVPNNKAIVRFGSGSTLNIDNGGITTVNTNNQLIIESGVILTIKNNGSLTLNDNGLLLIEQGASLIIENNGHLIVNENGLVKIKPGGKIIYESGAEIQLLGDNAVLEIQGTLEVGPNATFTFTYPNATSGFVRFKTEAQGPNIIATPTSAITFLGADKNDKVLEVVSGWVYPPDALSRFTLMNGKAELATESRLNIGCPLSIGNATIKSGGLNVFGQSFVFINNALFDGSGINGYLFYGKNRLSISNSTFRNGFGLRTIGEGIVLNNVIFENNFPGWQGIGVETTSQVRQCKFTGNLDFGITSEMSTGGSINLFGIIKL